MDVKIVGKSTRLLVLARYTGDRNVRTTDNARFGEATTTTRLRYRFAFVRVQATTYSILGSLVSCGQIG